ncbi:MAG: thiamine pyrophosphate-binding protein [Alphaproteobacteria bacterium]|nr:thiamine pyrophosphate-binding protein [Alphaproteobacteria bacterium]
MANKAKLLQEPVLAGEGIARVFEQAGIDMVFGIQGGNMGRLYDALYDHQETVRCVLVRHEQLASVMAEVYGRLTGKPGVCIGQGIFMLANGFLGTLEAHYGSSPMLFLTDFSDVAPFAQHAPYQSGRGEYGSADTRNALAAVTKRTLTALTPAEAVHAVQLGIKHALSGERGPVGVVFNSNAFLGGTVDPDARPFLYDTTAYLPAKLPGDPASVNAAAQALAAAERPVIIAGNGVRISQAYGELTALAQLVGAPVATTASGKGVFAETHDWALGACGNFGQAAANAYIGAADVVLAVGTRLGPADTTNENPDLIDPARQTLVQIDIEPKNASWTFPCDTVVIGDAALVLRQITETLQANGAPTADTVTARKAALDDVRQTEGFFADPHYESDAVPIMPPRLFKELHDVIADDALITCDAGENRLFMTHFFQTKGPGTLLMPGIGAMGYAVPAALTGKLVAPERQVIAVTGDGGFSMALNGIMTARDENIPIVTVILNNGALGWVKHGQGNRTISSTFAEMNYADIAKSIGVNGIRVEQPANIAGALAEALGSGKTTVVDVVTAFDGLSFRDVTSALAQG